MSSDWKEILMCGVSSNQLLSSAEYLSAEDYKHVLEERDNLHICAFPACNISESGITIKRTRKKLITSVLGGDLFFCSRICQSASNQFLNFLERITPNPDESPHLSSVTPICTIENPPKSEQCWSERPILSQTVVERNIPEMGRGKKFNTVAPGNINNNNDTSVLFSLQDLHNSTSLDIDIASTVAQAENALSPFARLFSVVSAWTAVTGLPSRFLKGALSLPEQKLIQQEVNDGELRKIEQKCKKQEDNCYDMSDDEEENSRKDILEAILDTIENHHIATICTDLSINLSQDVHFNVVLPELRALLSTFDLCVPPVDLSPRMWRFLTLVLLRLIAFHSELWRSLFPFPSEPKFLEYIRSLEFTPIEFDALVSAITLNEP